MSSFVVENFDYIMNLGDPRVKDWIGFSSPALTFTIIVIYLLSIYVFLPAYMKNRDPYKLKTVLKCYNIFQIVACAMCVYGLTTSGWTTTYSWICQPTDYSNNPEALRMLSWCYYVYLLKLVELLESVFFVLRKKFNQLSTLHVYHHCFTFIAGWIGVKYAGGGMGTLTVILNCFVHFFMYIYYFLSSLGEKWQKKLSKWKRWLTIFQMVQFSLIIIYGLIALHPECNVPKIFVWVYLPQIIIIFHMFWKFYKDNYLLKGKTAKSHLKKV